jgi:hypothetical protein
MNMTQDTAFHAYTVDDVMLETDRIIQKAHHEHDRIGYFACLYRHVTYAVKEGIAQNIFENGQRIAGLDVMFANRYFEALDYWQRGALAVQSWQLAFDASQRPGRIVMQHMFLAMNAHINLDLSIATARTFPGDELAGVQNDFNLMNAVLAKLVNHITGDLSHIWPILRLLHFLMNGEDERLFSYDMAAERARAWATAQRLAYMTWDEQEAEIRRMDAQVVQTAQSVLNPRFPVNLGITVFHWLQRETIPQIIDTLSDERLHQYLFTDLTDDEAEHAALDRQAAESDRPPVPEPD